MAKRPTPATPSHPLEGAALSAFQARAFHDRVTLSAALAGSPNPGGQEGTRRHNAYMLVSEDVLGFMEERGKVYKDDDGWYRLAEGAG